MANTRTQPQLPYDDSNVYIVGRLNDGQKLWRDFNNEVIIRAVGRYFNQKGLDRLHELIDRTASLPADR